MHLMSLSFEYYKNFIRPNINLESELLSNCSVYITKYSSDEELIKKKTIHKLIFDPQYDLEEKIYSLKNSINMNLAYGFMISVCDEVIGSLDIENIDDFICIMNLGIVPEYRNNGYGKLLLILSLDKVVEMYYAKFDKIYLMVDKSNLVAKILYESLGFVYED